MWFKELLKRVRNRFHRDITTVLEELIINNKALLKDNQLLLRENERMRADILSQRQFFKEEMSKQKESLVGEILNQNESLKKEILRYKEEDIASLAKVLKNEMLTQREKSTAEMVTSIKTLDSSLSKTIKSHNQNIKRHLFNYAGMQTAAYIIDHMPTTPAFSSNLDLLSFALTQVKIDGMYLEFGVYSGKTINHIASKIGNLTVYGFDSFQGLPESWRTGFAKGAFKRDSLPQVNENVELVQGWFDDTLPVFLNDRFEKCAFIHIDCDLYSSTQTVLDSLKDRIVPETIIVFDEYFNYPNWQNGEYKAFQEFITSSGLGYEYIGYVETLEQAAVRITKKG